MILLLEGWLSVGRYSASDAVCWQGGLCASIAQAARAFLLTNENLLAP
jgi:hypothetical protein